MKMSLSKYFQAKLPTPLLAEKPHQPLSFKFPKCEFGTEKSVVKRSFQPQWFARWNGYTTMKNCIGVLATGGNFVSAKMCAFITEGSKSSLKVALARVIRALVLHIGLTALPLCFRRPCI